MNILAQHGSSLQRHWWCGGFLLLLCAGCISLDDPASIQRLARVASIGSAETVTLKRVKPSPAEQLRRMIYQSQPELSSRNEQILRRYALLQEFEQDRGLAIDKLWTYAQAENNPELNACVTLVCSKQADFEEKYERSQASIDWHLLTLVSAWDYLWSPRFARTRNAYDPNFAEVTAAYNHSLEAMLRYLKLQQAFTCHQTTNIRSRWFDFEVVCKVEDGWQKEEFEKFEFVSDFNIKGLSNHHRQYGLGVPLIAVRSRQQENPRASEQFYPPNLALPLTAFLRLSPDKITPPGVDANDSPGSQKATKWMATVELIDPLRQSTVRIDEQETQLSTDITAPLAYYLNDPLYRSNLLATASLLDANLGKEVRGLYMLEPYDPAKIPVVMVHGFWSSAITWTEMFNDLRANPTLNKRYQFWFYMYPTGQPFWVSAAQMRQDMHEARLKLDPQRNALALNEMVLVGHSMGGLISLLQTVESGDHFWKLVSDQSVDELKGDAESIEDLRRTLFFSPNPDVRRVITLGTPYRGSDFANSTTRWLGRKLLTLPQWLVQNNGTLIKQNPGLFKRTELLTMETSIDSLAHDSPFFEALDKATPAPWTRYHNVIGNLQSKNWVDKWHQSRSGPGDGVVSLEDAQFAYASSMDEVDSKHMMIHQDAKSIWIVRQVLLQHLADTGTYTPVTRETGEGQPLTPNPAAAAQATSSPLRNVQKIEAHSAAIPTQSNAVQSITTQSITTQSIGSPLPGSHPLLPRPLLPSHGLPSARIDQAFPHVPNAEIIPALHAESLEAPAHPDDRPLTPRQP